MANKHPSAASGVMYALLGYVFWGITPIYWKLLSSVGPLQLLACRIIFALLFVTAVQGFRKNMGWVFLLRDKKLRTLIISASLAVTINWGGFIWAVTTGHTIESSLGYYINPLLSIIMGMVFLKEKLGILQWVSFLLAAVGVVLMTILSGSFPWISLLLALSFGIYGLLKKKIPVASMEALGAETLVVVPVALVMLFIPAWGGTDFLSLKWFEWAALSCCGIVTALPLYWYTRGIQLLPLSAMGFLQFINPTIQLMVGVFIFKEPFPRHNLIPFCFIWTAVLVFSFSIFLRQKKAP